MEKTAWHCLACMDITAAQLRAARALLSWNQQQLADASLVGVATIRRFEAGMSRAIGALQQRGLRQALEAPVSNSSPRTATGLA